MNDDLIEIAVLGRPHGIRGEVRLQYFADSTELLDGELYLGTGKQPPRRIVVQRWRLHQGIPLVIFEGFDDRTKAEPLRGQRLFVPASMLPPLDDDEVYLHELLGLQVVLDDSGLLVGTLEGIDDQGAQELWHIVAADKKELFLPAVPEFVAAVDLDAECIRITPPEGLLELYGFTI